LPAPLMRAPPVRAERLAKRLPLTE
jgi:hypothetical protein